MTGHAVRPFGALRVLPFGVLVAGPKYGLFGRADLATMSLVGYWQPTTVIGLAGATDRSSQR